jgi:hypothetical protein
VEVGQGSEKNYKLGGLEVKILKLNNVPDRRVQDEQVGLIMIIVSLRFSRKK